MRKNIKNLEDLFMFIKILKRMKFLSTNNIKIIRPGLGLHPKKYFSEF